jgi:hypothetical protein
LLLARSAKESRLQSTDSLTRQCLVYRKIEPIESGYGTSSRQIYYQLCN